MSKLTERQAIFVDEYVRTNLSRQSAINAGYSANSASSTAYENLSKRHIAEAIEAQRKDREAKIARYDAAKLIVDEQADYDGLWAVPVEGAQSISEAFLQQELRRLHAAIEGITPDESTRVLIRDSMVEER